MAVTVWKGHLTFGLVSIPIRLFRAARAEKISFHQLYRPEPPQSAAEPAPSIVAHNEAAAPSDQPALVARIQQGALTRDDHAPIPRSEIMKGYEDEKDRYVVIEKEDIAKITPKTPRETEIVEFV